MSNFNVEHNKEGDSDILSLKGHIDEDAVFENVTYGDSSQLIIDFNKVSAINSCGIREWITWIQKAPPEKKIVYRNCPKIIVDQANMVSGFVPPNGVIESFYVPYYCESTDNEKMVLFVAGKEFEGDSISAPEVKDEESGEEMEMDVIEAKYFKFLKS